MKSAEAGFFLDSKNLDEVECTFASIWVIVSPEEQMLSTCDIQVSRILLHAFVTELWFGHTKPIPGERGVGNKFV
jgi:hypothetical protein